MEACRFRTIVKVRTQRDAMTAPQRLALEACGMQAAAMRRPRRRSCPPTMHYLPSRHATRPIARVAASDRRSPQRGSAGASRSPMPATRSGAGRACSVGETARGRMGDEIGEGAMRFRPEKPNFRVTNR